jgi:ribonuclease BN (tRNA processing enzyme)
VTGPSGLKLQFVGTGDAFGSGGRFQTCLRLAGPEGSLLLDCGASSLIAMKRLGVDPGEVGWVCLSHLHGDHFGGVPFLILDGQFSRRRRPLVVAGPPGVASRVQAAMEVLFPGSTGVTRAFPVEFVELDARRPAPVGPAMVTAFPVEHASGAPPYALRVAWRDRVVAYSGDTEWTGSLLEAAREADVFVCEAYSYDRRIRYHLDYRTVAAQRERLGCRRLILTHMSRDVLERGPSEVQLERAEDGQVVVV